MKADTTVSAEGLLAEAGRLLASSLELDATLRTITRLAVPELADWAAVDLLEPDGSLHQLSSGHADPATDALLTELRRRHRAGARLGEGTPPPGVLAVIASGEPAVFAPAPSDALPLEGEEERSLWEAIGVASLLVVPMRVGDERVGALTLLSTDPERIYGDKDLPVALELADRCAQALHNARLYGEAESGRALLDTLLATAPVGLCLFDADLRFVLLNERMAALNGRPMDEHVGRPLLEVLGPDAEPAAELAREVLATGRGASDVEVLGRGRAFLASYAPVSVEGRVLGVVCAVIETTERHNAQAAVERLLDRTARLQAVTEQLAGALSARDVAEVIVRAGMAATGASCGVLGLRDDDALRIEHRFGMAGAPPSALPLAAEAPMPLAMREARPVLLASRDAWLERFPAVAPRGDFEAFAAVPLLFEDAVPGVMGLGFEDVGELDPGSVEALVAIARQGALALERARLYEERAYVARTLQEGLLPRELPAIDGLDIAVRYRPLGDGSEVGGDFYDLFALDASSWLVGVGDICGKGTSAAVLTGVVRSTIRALALRERDPAEILRGVNEALLRERSPQALATVACATVTASGDGFAATISAAGHPPPMVLRASGVVESVDAGGTLLGALEEPSLSEAVIALAPGDLLLLYTDGVIDAHRNRDEPFGEARLEAALASAAGGDATDVLEAIDAAVRAYAPGPPRDDKALLAIRVG